MNPSGGGLFGASPQGGAFQVPGGGGSNINKPGMFQSAFGSQQQPQSAGFFQSGTFPQHPAMMQQGHTVAGGGSAGTSMFGQTPSFGQTSSSSLGQSSMFGQPQGPEPATPMSQAFGQSSSMSSSSMFGAGGGSTPAFGQVSGAVFGQTPAFGQQSAFGQQPPVFSLSSAVSSHTMTNTGSSSSSTTTGSFGHTPFGQPLSTGSSSSSAGLVFGSTAQGPSSGLVFGSTTAPGSSQSGKGLAALPQFSFKPSTEVLFKPIFSASPEPPPPPPLSSSSSSNTHPDPSSSGSEMMSHSAEAPPPAPPPPLTLGFSFSQPANISAQKEPQASSSSTSSAAALQFTFSQPAAPCAGANAAPPTEPTTPSKFSFSSKVLQPQIVAPMFGSSGFGQPSAFGDAQKAQAGHADERGGGSSLSSTADREATGEANPFAAAAARPGKGTKRKESPSVPEDGPDENRTKTDESAPTEETSRHAQKRPLLRSRGPVAGLFGRALSGVLKDARREPQRDRSPAQQQPMSQAAAAADWTDSAPAQGGQVGAPPPQAPATTREVLERELVETTADSAKAAKAAEPPATPPARRSQRAESSGGEGAVSPSELGELTALQVKNVPPQLNKKDLLTKHFGQYGALRTIHCRPHKNLAIVHYRDHESAARAKKKGKNLQRHELYILWQRKKQSPAEKGKRERAPPPPRRQQQEEETKAQSSSSSSSSPLRRATAPPRVPPVGGTFTRSVSSPVKKPAAARTLQQLMDSDGQQRGEEPSQDGPPPNSSSASSSDRPVPSSILHLIGQLAETAEDKYRLLEQKDKILRQGRSKRTDLDMSKVFVGTCPDMCPEKERYMRETRNQLSAFEVLPDTEMVDHRAAIKEYSRSSADQEEPLPHELRPLPVLSRTMDYLVTQILDQPRESTRDWYDFVWNRTRAIRKDITQQHLCCPLTVSLIEKCTRFHVHCAHHLCEERLMTFDPKINNENMTKCLQSLKEMYQDLATRGVYCPQEAEFRQYNILVKLDDGDILREVQQYHPSVRNSPEVQFAVQCFSALNCNNFVRFFKLVKSASYLPGCLLHRYFNQVRAKALKTLNVAHTVGSHRSTSFPVEDMTRMLMFRDSVEASDYMTQYGLTVSDGQVELSRTAYQEPELALSQRRSEVIQGKMSALIGQVVNGGVLPRPPQHTPVYSFDAHNKFTGGETAFTARPDVKSETTSSDVEVWPPVVRAPPPAPRSRPQTPQQQQQQDACSTPVPPPEDTTTTTTCSTPTLPPEADVVQRPQEQPVKVPTPPPPAPVYTDEDIVCEVDSMVEEVLGSEVNEVALSGFAYISVALAESSVQVEALVSEVVGEELWDVSSNQIRLEAERIAEEKRKVDEARRRQEREVILSHYSASLATELIQEVVDQSIRETADQQIREEQEEKEELISRCTEQQCSVLLEETLEADIALLVENVLRAELQRIRKYIKRWLDVVAVRRQLKRQMRGFPAAPCCVDPRFKLKALTPSAPQRPCMEQLARGVVNLGNAGTVTFSSTRFDQKRQEAVHQMRVQYYFQQLLNESVWRPLDLPALVMENLPNPPDRVYWKTTLLLPGDHDGHTSLEDRILSDWLEVKLGGDKRSEVTEKRPDGALQTLYVSNTLTEHAQRTHTVHVSIKVSRGPLSEDSLLKAEEGLELQGTGGLVLLLPAQDGASSPGREDAGDDVALLSALLQLRQLQQVSGWHCPLPLVVLVPGGGAGGGGACGGPRLEEALMLDSLVGEGLLSEYTLMYIPETTSDLQGAQQVQQAVAWLLSRCPPSVQVSSQTLVQLVDGALTREFTSRLCVHHAERRSSALGPEAPGPVIGLYNAVLEHLATAVSSQALASLSWPPGEFYQAELRHLLPPVGWNSEGHLAWLRRALLSLQVPAWTPEPHRHASWSELCESIYQYCSLIPASRHRAPLLMSRLDHLLHSVSLRGRGSSQGVPGTLRTPRGAAETLAYEHVPWDDIVLLCIDHKMKDWPPAGPPVCEGSVTEDGEVLVYFLSETLGGFEPPEEWSEAVRRTHTLRQQRDSGAPPTSSPAFRLGGLFSRSRPGAPPPLDVTHAPSARAHTPSDMELLPQRVLHRLHEESALSHRSTEQLRDWLNADPAEHLATPLFLPSSTLLATPSWTLPTSQHSATSRPGGEAKPEEPARKKTPPPSVSSRGSLSRRLQELQRQIAAGQEEELSFRLKLDNMMSIVDD